MKRTIKGLFFIGVFILVSYPAFSQNRFRRGQNFQDRIKAQKIAFFTEKIQLTVQEAERFWPVYNEFENDKNKIAIERNKTTNYYTNNIRTLSDAELEEIVDKYIYLHKEEAELSILYHQKFKEILPIRKVMKMYQADIQFKTLLLQQIRQRGNRLNLPGMS